ncbi:unnamed protein product [Klebsiella pneumoniae]|nr:unnamed protein product [Klebsiella pneumoniae]
MNCRNNGTVGPYSIFVGWENFPATEPYVATPGIFGVSPAKERTRRPKKGLVDGYQSLLRMSMNVELHTEQGVKIIVPLVRRLDASVVQAFKQQVLEAIDPDTKNVLLDLNHVDFIDSSCLGALVSILKSVNGQGELALCSLNDTIKNLFKLTRMDRIFSIKETRQDALNAFTSL